MTGRSGKQPPTVVIGAGADGLAAACFLARAGRAVVLMERTSRVGGSFAPEVFHPGYHAPGLDPSAGLVRRRLLAPLDLGDSRLGSARLRWRGDRAPTWTRLQCGSTVALPASEEAAASGGSGLPEAVRADQAGWLAFLGRIAPTIRRLVDRAPPPLAPEGGKGASLISLLPFLSDAVSMRLLGRKTLEELTRVVPLPATDWLGEVVHDAGHAAALAGPALFGAVRGPRAPGTGGLLLLDACLRGVEPVGGPAALIAALQARAAALGVEIRTEAGVRRILMHGPSPGVVEGVELESGETMDATTVLASIDPVQLISALVPANRVDPAQAARTGSWRPGGATTVVRFALERMPVPAGAGSDAAPLERAVLARDLAHMERASDATKYGLLPEDPWIDLSVFSDCAPEGGAVAIARVHGTPYDLRGEEGGWTSSARDRIGALASERLEAFAPGSTGTVVAQEVLAPPDIEHRTGATGGSLVQLEMTLDQMWMRRPSLELSRYRTPWSGLYLCGRGTHPGGGLVGGSAALAARMAVADGRRTGR